MSTRTSGKPPAKQPAPTPATPYAGPKETKQDTIKRLRMQRGVLLTKKSSAEAVESDLRAQLAQLHGQVSELKASNASNSKDSSSSASNSKALSKRVQEMQTAAENAMSDQRARYRAKLEATRSELAMANSSIAAMNNDREVVRRDHELERTVLNNDLQETRKSHLSLSAEMIELRKAYASMVNIGGGAAACQVEDPVDTPVRPSPAPHLSTIVSDSAAEAAESAATPTPSPHGSDADDDSNSEADDDASAVEQDALTSIDAFMHRMAHNKELGESSDDEPGLAPVELLASGGAKSSQLGSAQRARLSERAREQSAAVDESARRERAASSGAAATAAALDVKAAFRVQAQPATMDFSEIGTPAATTESPGTLRSARALASGVASATLSMGKSSLQGGSGGTTASQLAASLDGGMSLGADFVDESPVGAI